MVCNNRPLWQGEAVIAFALEGWGYEVAEMRKLESTVDLLEAIQEKHDLESDGQIARLLGVKQQVVSTWRTGVRTPGDDHALSIAWALDISPALVLAIAAGERARGKETQKVWRKLAEQLARGVVPSIAVLGMLSGGYTPPAKAQSAEFQYSVKSRRRRVEALQPTP